MTTDTYNGWRNYETWLANLWFDNDEHTYHYWRKIAAQLLDDAIDDCDTEPADAKREATYALSNRLAEWIDENANNAKEAIISSQSAALAGLFVDALSSAINQIECHDIAEHMIDAAFEEFEN